MYNKHMHFRYRIKTFEFATLSVSNLKVCLHIQRNPMLNSCFLQFSSQYLSSFKVSEEVLTQTLCCGAFQQIVNRSTNHDPLSTRVDPESTYLYSMFATDGFD